MIHTVVVQSLDANSRLVYAQGRCPPSFPAAGVVNAASQQVPGLIPGSLATLYGLELGPAAGYSVAAVDEATKLLITSANGVEVRFDEVAAPLFYIRRGQINLQVPLEVAGRSSSKLRVIFSGISSPSVDVPVASVGPGFFSYDSSGTGLVIAVNEQGTINRADNGAARGSIVVLYLTGHGQTSPPLLTGQLGSFSEPFPRPTNPITLSIDGKDAAVLFCGAAPGFAGLLQMNVRIPADANPGVVEVRARTSGFTSRAGTTISIR